MKTIKEKYLVVGADFAGYPLKEAVVAHLKEKGWKITDLGVTDPDSEDTENMFHRVGLRVAAQVLAMFPVFIGISGSTSTILIKIGPPRVSGIIVFQMPEKFNCKMVEKLQIIQKKRLKSHSFTLSH